MSDARPQRPPKPLWRKAIDDVDSVVAPALVNLVRGDAFAVGLTAFVRIQRQAAATRDELGEWVLHAVNLPARSDLDRVSRQLAEVERRLRSLDEGPLDEGPLDGRSKDAEPHVKRGGDGGDEGAAAPTP